MSNSSLAAAPTIDTAPTDKAYANQQLETAQKPDFSNKSLDGILKDVGRYETRLSQQPEHEYRRLMQSSSMDGMRKVKVSVQQSLR